MGRVMRLAEAVLQRRQAGLLDTLARVYCGRGEVVAGMDQTDVRGKRLNLDYSHLIKRTAQAVELGQPVLDLLQRLKTDEAYRKKIAGSFAGYDVRTSETDPALWVLFGLAFAKSIIDSTGKKTGHTVFLGRDCYTQHEEVLSVMAYTLLQTGITRNGGGIINMGITDGGSMKLAGGKINGHWFFATISHKVGPYRGGKTGLNGKVLTTQRLMAEIFDRIMKEDFPALVVNAHPSSYVTTMSPASYLEQQTALAERAIRARTSVAPEVPRKRLLEGVKLAVKLDESPLVENNVALLRALGAEVVTQADTWTIRDPNEAEEGKESAGIKDLELFAEAQKMMVPFWDPDQDRFGLVFLNAAGKAMCINGSDFLLLVAHNLITHKPLNRKIQVVGDSRALIPLDVFGRQARAMGYDVEVISSEPGYSKIQEGIAEHDAATGGERTWHFFPLLLSSRLWGAPEDIAGTQGGDNGPVSLCYLLAMQKYNWEGRNPVEQLARIREEFQTPDSVSKERKPTVDDTHGLAKITVAKHMREVAARDFGDFGQDLEVQPMDSAAAEAIIADYARNLR